MHIFDNKEVKIRKPRFCWGCAGKFKAGNKLQVCSYVEDGHFSHVYWCKLCFAYLKTMQDGDSFALGEFKYESDYIKFKNSSTGKLIILETLIDEK